MALRRLLIVVGVIAVVIVLVLLLVPKETVLGPLNTKLYITDSEGKDTLVYDEFNPLLSVAQIGGKTFSTIRWVITIKVVSPDYAQYRFLSVTQFFVLLEVLSPQGVWGNCGGSLQGRVGPSQGAVWDKDTEYYIANFDATGTTLIKKGADIIPVIALGQGFVTTHISNNGCLQPVVGQGPVTYRFRFHEIIYIQAVGTGTLPQVAHDREYFTEFSLAVGEVTTYIGTSSTTYF